VDRRLISGSHIKVCVLPRLKKRGMKALPAKSPEHLLSGNKTPRRV
jgi:hypothetical protein